MLCVLPNSFNNRCYLLEEVRFFFDDFVCFWQEPKNGLPAHVCHPAPSHHTGYAVHRNHGEGSRRFFQALVTYQSVCIMWECLFVVLVGVGRHGKLRPMVQLQV